LAIYRAAPQCPATTTALSCDDDGGTLAAATKGRGGLGSLGGGGGGGKYVPALTSKPGGGPGVGPGDGPGGPGGPGGGDGVHPKAPVQEAQQSFKLLNGPGGSPGKVISQSFPIPATLAHLYVLSPAAERPPGVVAPLGPTRGKERGAKWCRGEGIATCPGSGGIEFAGRSGGRSGGGAGGACSPSDAAADSATDEAATRSTARAPVAARARMPAMSRASGTVLGWPHTRVDAAPRATQAGAGAGADDVPMLMVCTAPRGAGAPRGRE
jgi:hypothetical protein